MLLFWISDTFRFLAWTHSNGWVPIQVVTYPSTDQGPNCLTPVIGRELVKPRKGLIMGQLYNCIITMETVQNRINSKHSSPQLLTLSPSNLGILRSNQIKEMFNSILSLYCEKEAWVRRHVLNVGLL